MFSHSEPCYNCDRHLTGKQQVPYGVCRRTDSGCRKIYERLSRRFTRRGTIDLAECELCGADMRKTSPKYRLCNKRPECVLERNRREYAARKGVANVQLNCD